MMRTASAWRLLMRAPMSSVAFATRSKLFSMAVNDASHGRSTARICAFIASSESERYDSNQPLMVSVWHPPKKQGVMAAAKDT